MKSRRRGFSSGFAVAGIVIGGIGTLVFALILAFAVPALVDAAQTCARLGVGVHHLNRATYTSTPTSFSVYWGS